MKSTKNVKSVGITITNENNKVIAKTGDDDDSKNDDKPSIVDNLLSEYNKNTDYSHNDEKVDMQILAQQAAQEFELLAQQNDDIFKEKEQFKQKYDDLSHDIEQLNEKMEQFEFYKEQHQQLTSENLKYKSQSTIFDQEKLIMQETINDLKQQYESTNTTNEYDTN
eukprot:243057_1